MQICNYKKQSVQLKQSFLHFVILSLDVENSLYATCPSWRWRLVVHLFDAFQCLDLLPDALVSLLAVDHQKKKHKRTEREINLSSFYYSAALHKQESCLLGVKCFLCVGSFYANCVCFVWKHGVLCFMPSYAQQPCRPCWGENILHFLRSRRKTVIY